MAKVLRAVGTVAGVLSVVLIPFNPPLASVMALVSAAASVGAQLLQKKPGIQGGVNSVTIGANSPVPYGMGRCFTSGAQLNDVGYGGKVGKTRNPYLSKVFIWSVSTAFAIDAVLFDFNVINFSGTSAQGYYHSWLYLDRQLGLRPEPDALAGPWGPIPDWGSDYKLSNYAAGLFSYRFDRDNKRWANGIPVHGVVGRWAKVYDWRKDSTYPGGSGSHRWDDEATYEYDPNVALNAITYARGRYAVGGDASMRMAGCGFPQDSIDWPAWNAFANVCDANGWEVNGFVYDGPGISLWDNLKRICAAGAAIPVISGGLLSVRFQSPKVALDTITPDDFAEGERMAPAMRTWKDRINTMVPKYRSEANKWEYVQSDAIAIEEYIALDGEPKEEENPCELVTDKDQAAQITYYELFNRRELTGWTYPLKPRLWEVKLGEAYHLTDPEFGIDHLVVVAAIDKDPGRATLTVTFETETNAKHPVALAMTGTAPPPPTLQPPGAGDGIAWDGEITADLTGLTVDLTTRTVDET
ncbi:MAG: hypothetical protein C0494_17605 [Sphingobium sp.]|nr:hypothetical protein [Sphingobium sp.]